MKFSKLCPFVCITAIFAASAISAAQAQTPQPNSAPSPSFEVASIKPDAEPGMGVIGGEPGTYKAVRISAQFLLMTAFNVKPFQILNEPPWVLSQRFDIEAKADDAMTGKIEAMAPDERLAETRLMLQSLLAERFKLVAHRTTHEMPVLSLVVSKSGRLPVSQKVCGATAGPPPTQQPGKWPTTPCGGVFQMFGHIAGDDVPIDQLVSALAIFTRQDVENNTGLTGKYDIALDWTPDPGETPPPPPGSTFPEPDPNGPSLQGALQDQLGLKLESTKGPVDTIVIDHIEEPTPN